MKKLLKYSGVYAGMIFLLFQYCSTPKGGYLNSNNLYKKDNHELSASFVVYHENDSVSKLYFKIPNQNLVYKRPDTSRFFYSCIKVSFVLKSEINSKKILDSSHVVLFDRQNEVIKDRNLSSTFNMKAFIGKKYSADVTVTDINKKTKNDKIIEVDKSTAFKSQNFLAQKINGEPFYNNYFSAHDTVYLKNNSKEVQELFVDYFYHDFPLPPPPFSPVQRKAQKYNADSSFSIKRTGNLFKLSIPVKGFYQVKSKSDNFDGLTLYSVEPAFPGMKNETDMIKSTRYIMTKSEYDDCLNNQNKKGAIDEFWKDIGGSNERAKELLKKYYGRVTETNKMFTSFQPGWQSDRGMIYIVFGPPNSTYKYENSEQWIYGNEGQPNAIRFDFVKVDSPFSGNDYVLTRNEYYKLVWYEAVTNWRQGHIYLDY